MDDYAGRVLADRYRLPLDASAEEGAGPVAAGRAFDTYSGQEVSLQRIPLPDIVEGELPGEGPAAGTGDPSGDPLVRRALDAARAAAQVPDHPRLNQVFDVFAEGDALWIVSEYVPGRALGSLLAERPLNPYRAAEVAADVLTALRALHAGGWVHRNITEHTVLLAEDGRVVLAGLAAGAAQEALCGYDPVPPRSAVEDGAGPEGPRPRGVIDASPYGGGWGSGAMTTGPGRPTAAGSGGHTGTGTGPGGGAPAPRAGGAPGAVPPAFVNRPATPAAPALAAGSTDPRAARAGAIAAYRAGARAAARAQAEGGPGAARPAPGQPAEPTGATAPEPEAPGRISDPYGVRERQSATSPHEQPPRLPADPRNPRNPQTSQNPQASQLPPAPWHGAAPRTGNAPGAAPGAIPGPAPEAVPPLPLPPEYRRGPAMGPSAPVPQRLTPQPRPHQAPDGLSSNDPGALAPYASAQSAAPVPDPPTVSSPAWDSPVSGYGPGNAVEAERARQVRMVVVGPVTERWAPEQAGPVRGTWQLAAPVGPATDLWALGVLLFRAVQGHGPYPEESTAELVHMVCAEAPAFAEECGPLRPVVESLLRQDPTERPDFEELRGWLRSLVRSAPEPDAGAHLVPAPAFDPAALPIKRRRGELVRRKRRPKKAAKKAAREAVAPAEPARPKPVPPVPRSHRRAREAEAADETTPLYGLAAAYSPPEPPGSARTASRGARGRGAGRTRQTRPPARDNRRPRAPRSLGRTLLVAVFVLVAGTIVYAMVFLPKADESDQARTGTELSHAPGSLEKPAPTSAPPASSPAASPEEKPKDEAPEKEKKPSGPKLPAGFVLYKDPAGFQLAVPQGWTRHARNPQGQVRWTQGSYELIVVPGRDSVTEFGNDLLRYQRESEPETRPFRESSWVTSTGMREIEEGGRKMAEGQFTWPGDDGDTFARNMVMAVNGKYHVLQVRGLDANRDDVSRYYEQALATYQVK
ncbi:protein kinase [Streptomyces sp. NPDC088923]|uniref:protein kinase domain-containing protein n=1 Tax=Streptomyces sp. NPDC088923 TaxID=3365913 RepID=UPI00382EA521